MDWNCKKCQKLNKECLDHITEQYDNTDGGSFQAKSYDPQDGENRISAYIRKIVFGE